MHEAGTKGIPLGMDIDGSMVPEAKAEGKKHTLRDFKITKSILSRHGYTDDCQGCVASVFGHQRQHNNACKSRIEANVEPIGEQ